MRAHKFFLKTGLMLLLSMMVGCSDDDPVTPPPPPADTTPPASVANLGISSSTASSITLTWTAPGDDGTNGTATAYDIRFSTTLITNANFNAATQAPNLPVPSTAGTGETLTVTGLTANTTHHFALKTADEVPNVSGLSNVANATIPPQFVLKWGSVGAGDGQFANPHGIAVDGSGNVYVADFFNHRIQKFNGTGTFGGRLGTQGSGDGQFSVPHDVTVDGIGNIYVADTGNHRIQKFNGVGVFLTKWGSIGTGDGQFGSVGGLGPHGIAVGGSHVYVADSANNRIQMFIVSGAFLMKWGSVGTGDGQFNFPTGVAVDGSGNVYVADVSNRRIQKFDVVGTFLTKWGSQGAGDGQFDAPNGVAVDGSGNVYVTDVLNHRIQKFDGTGTFLAKWGSQGAGDGQFSFPMGVAVDGSGNVYVVDTSNNRIQKFK